jgi:uncharacterized DUF497 family protein
VNLASGLDWDAANLTKCQAHGVSVEDIESLFRGRSLFAPDLAHSAAEDRFIAVGRTGGGRAVFVAFTFRDRAGRRLVRPISARYMHVKEARRYDEKGPGSEN